MKTFHVPPSVAKEVIKRLRPNLYLLMNAGWRAGYTVNGIPAAA